MLRLISIFRGEYYHFERLANLENCNSEMSKNELAIVSKWLYPQEHNHN